MNDLVSLRGHFLVAMPDSDLPSELQGTVVYLCVDTPEKAYGIVINRPSSRTLSGLLEDLGMSPLGDFSQSVFLGGSNNKNAWLVLHTPVSPPYACTGLVTDEIQATSSKDVLEDIAIHCGPNQWLVAMGCVYWDKGELVEELANNNWIHVPACEKILFQVPPENRWEAAIEQLGVGTVGFVYEAGHA